MLHIITTLKAQLDKEIRLLFATTKPLPLAKGWIWTFGSVKDLFNSPMAKAWNFKREQRGQSQAGASEILLVRCSMYLHFSARERLL